MVVVDGRERMAPREQRSVDPLRRSHDRAVDGAARRECSGRAGHPADDAADITVQFAGGDCGDDTGDDTGDIANDRVVADERYRNCGGTRW